MATAQIKFDYNWVLGYPADINFPNPKYNGTLVDFNAKPTEYYYFDIGVKLNANAAISDSAGKLLFYTNGCEIINKNHKKMNNGDDINAGGLSFQQECKSNIYPYGYSTHQGVLILPFPDMPNQYVLLHLRKSDTISREYILDLLYSIVDISGDDGFGAVLSKNNFVYHDTFCDMLTAVRHGNGRDWWILIPRYNTAEYYTFLLSPEGIGKPIIQKIGEPIKNFRWGVQAAFSPNGAKYVNHTPLGGLQILVVSFYE
ncbi:MAG: hypothetical protein KF734_09150 [Saprospiraceae bacterium]|nr:hypothetical protein [Saprospiraceae bacterium]